MLAFGLKDEVLPRLFIMKYIAKNSEVCYNYLICEFILKGTDKMGLTLTEKILNAHIVDGEAVRGSEIGIKIDQTLTQDATGTMAYLELKQKNLLHISTITPCSQALKMLMTTDLSAQSQKNTVFISAVPVTEFAIRCI